MTHTPRVRPKVGAARVVAIGAVAVGALSGGSAFTAATAYPFSPGSPPSVPFSAAIWFGVAAAVTAASAGLLRRAGRSWAAALGADALACLPLALLWIAFLAPRPETVAAPLFWCAVTSAAAAKLGLWAATARGWAVAVTASAAARRLASLARWLSPAGRGIAPLALAALAARCSLLHLYNGLSLPEEGLLAHAAQVILSGGVVYRDLRIVLPPGAPYLHAGMSAALGRTLVVGKIALFIGPALLPLAVYFVSQRIMPAGIAFLAAAVVALMGDGSLALFFALVALGVGFSRTGDRRANWFLAGVLAGVSAAFDLVVGVSAGLALALTLYLRQRTFIMRRVGAAGTDLALGSWALMPLAAGALLVWVPLALYFLSRGALGALGGDLLSGARGDAFRLLRPLPSALDNWAAPAVLAAGAGLVVARLAARRLSEVELVALTVIAFGAMGWGWARRSEDPYHLALFLPLAYMVAAWVFGWAGKAAGQSFVGWPAGDYLRVLRAAAAAAVLVAGALGLSGWGRALAGHAGEIARARTLIAPPAGWRPLELSAAGGAYMSPQAGKALAGVVDYVQRHTLADEAVLCTPAGAAIYFLADRPGATRLTYAYAGEAPPGEAAEAVVDVESGKVRMVVVVLADAPWQRGEALEPLIAGYLARRYQRVARFGDYVVLLRKGASPTPKATPPPESRPERAGPVPPASVFGPNRK